MWCRDLKEGKRKDSVATREACDRKVRRAQLAKNCSLSRGDKPDCRVISELAEAMKSFSLSL